MTHATPRLRLRVCLGEEIAMGPGKADLLEAIQETGSISAAARNLDMSYRRAWQLVAAMNRCFQHPLVITSRGGAGRGGAAITAAGRQALHCFRGLETAAMAAVQKKIASLEALLVQAEAH